MDGGWGEKEPVCCVRDEGGSMTWARSKSRCPGKGRRTNADCDSGGPDQRRGGVCPSFGGERPSLEPKSHCGG